MRGFKFISAVLVLLASITVRGEIQIIDGVKYECRDGMCMPVEDSPSTGDATPSIAESPRILQGYVRSGEFIKYLEGSDGGSSPLDAASGNMALLLILVLIGGLSMNLTPCVLPMVPVNLMIIGRSAPRGVAYGSGIAIAYGVLGIMAAIGGMAFGAIQSSPWFNLAVAIVFAILALALLKVFFIDFSRLRKRNVAEGAWPIVRAFTMGALSAVLAGACVAPILIAVLLLTADMFARGNVAALALPFVMGVGMALPWPFVAAGMKVLPKPGAWVEWVNKVFAAVMIGFALWYGMLAYRGFSPLPADTASQKGIVMTPANFSLEGLKRPVLVKCWATWCKSCSAMDRVLESAEVAERVKDFTLISLQAEKISELSALPGFASIKGLPAFLIFESPAVGGVDENGVKRK